MLEYLPPARVLHEWNAISAGLHRAMARDPERSWLDILGQAISGQLAFWRVRGAGDGHLVTQVTRQPGSLRRVFWVIYAGGIGGDLAAKRSTMQLVEAEAVKSRCAEVRFEGRNWRKVLPDYEARKGDDGRWNFRKVLT